MPNAECRMSNVKCQMTNIRSRGSVIWVPLLQHSAFNIQHSSFLSVLLPDSPYCPSGRLTRVLAVAKYLRAVDEDVPHADGVLVRRLERRSVGDGRRIERHDVGEHAGLEQ